MTSRGVLSKRLPMITSLLIISAAISCSDKVIGPQTADITPIRELTFTKPITNIGTVQGFKKTVENGIYLETKAKNAEGLKEAFQKEYRKDYPNYEYTVIWIGIENYDNVEKARAVFDRVAVDSKLKPQGSDDNRHLISQIIQPRTDPEGGYRLMKTFRSKLVFQKSNLLIYINEDKSDTKRDTTWKDEVIRDVANALERIE
jgi:hypothetical protein